MKRFAPFLAFFFCFSGVAAQTKTVEVDFSAALERVKDFGGVNGGPEVLPPKGSLTTPDAAIQTYKDAGVTSIRTHDMANLQYFEYAPTFWKDKQLNPSFDPTVEANYLWTAADRKIDSIVNFGFTPYFRLGINYDAGNDVYAAIPYDPDGKNFTRFAEVCKRTVLHYNKGAMNGKRLGISYWEVWNEPDGSGFWRNTPSSPITEKGDSAAFARMYKAVSDSLKSADSTIKVGMPGMTSNALMSRRPWFSYVVNACRDAKATLDFFSWHLYSVLNPYAIAIEGAYVRSVLDAAGYKNAESHVSETNIRLGQEDAASSRPLINTPKHAAYTASQLIAAQMGGIDKIYFYRGTTFMNYFNSDTLGGQPNPKISGRALKAFTELARYAPQRIKADGSEFVESELSARPDTLNVMTLAGRSDDQKRCYVLVSNYNSSYQSATVNVKNLPWAQGSVKQTVTRINAAGVVSESSQTLAPGSTLKIEVSDMTAPAVALVRLENATATAVQDEAAFAAARLLEILPNPAGGETTARFRLERRARARLALYDALGREAKVMLNEELSAGDHAVTFDASDLPNAAYFVRLQTPFVTSARMIRIAR